MSGPDVRYLRELEELVASMKSEKVASLCPHTPFPKQIPFLESTAREAFYGGAAGGGKSDALLMGALQYADTPGYNAVIFRRTLQDLIKPEAIMNRALEWLLPHTRTGRVHWNSEQKIFTFKPSGATLSFSYMDCEKDKLNHQGAAYQFIGWDELTQFPETWYTYLMSRLRRLVGSNVPTRVRSAGNPGGIGHDWVFKRFVEGGIGREIKPFFPSKMTDNPYLDQADYLESLSELDEVTRQQLLQGVWVRDAAGLVYPFQDCDIIESAPALTNYLLAMDYGFTDDTSFTVIGWRDHDPHVYIVESYKLSKCTPSRAAEEADMLNQKYRFQKMVGDIGGLGKGYVEEARRRFGLPIEPAEKVNKIGYIKLMVGDMERHRIKVVKTTCEPLLAEWRALYWTLDFQKEQSTAPNHCADGALYGFRAANAFYNREKPAPKSAMQKMQEEEDAYIRALEEDVKKSDEDTFSLL